MKRKKKRKKSLPLLVHFLAPFVSPSSPVVVVLMPVIEPGDRCWRTSVESKNIVSNMKEKMKKILYTSPSLSLSW